MGKCISYYLGANTGKGFVSAFEGFIRRPEVKFVYVLKGGPGCGKSSFIRNIALALQDIGCYAEYILCSADPDSLDGVFFPYLGVAYLDGTAPHVLEPSLAEAKGNYVNLGTFCDTERMAKISEEAARLIGEYKNSYANAYERLGAACAIKASVRNESLNADISKRLEERASSAARREIKRLSGPGGQKDVFLDSFGSQGFVSEWQTAAASASRILLADNELGYADHYLSFILAEALSRGASVTVCRDALFPSRIAHLLIPEHSLAVLSETKDSPCPLEGVRRVRLDCLISGSAVNRSESRSDAKLVRSLLTSAQKYFRRAKEYHDELEYIINPYVDFGGVYTLSDAHAALLKEKFKEKVR
ncbi:MAG: hypothetical protein GXY20_00235 [Clostridiales bacterium]|nr:hypothetical protein [Clostridiales bacterium]